MIDLAVAGGGPAGLCTAIAAARLGLEVRVYEPRAAPIDKACGEGLMPAGLAALQSLGVDPPGHAFVGIRYIQGTSQATGDFRSGPGRGVRRTALQRSLRDAADRAGVVFADEAVRLVRQDADGVELLDTRARYLAVADGLSSPLRASLGLDRPTRWPERLGLRRHYGCRPWTDRVEVHWSPRCEAYVTPVAEDEVGVAVLFRREALPRAKRSEARYAALLSDFPALVERLGEPTSAVRGAGPFAREVSQRTVGRVLLVGDAAGYLDPLTGEGLRLAAECAQAAATAVQAGELAAYEQAWVRITRDYYRWTGLLLRAAGSGHTRPWIVPVAATMPGLMGHLVRKLGD